ncbi:MAG: glycosyltransferase family 1 protein [Spirochaetota bacterium]
MADMHLLDIPHFNVPWRYLSKCVVTIHDIIPYKMKQFFPSFAKQIYLKLNLTLIRRFAKKVVTVSAYTAQDLQVEFGFSAQQMQVIYNAVDHTIFFPETKAGDEEFLGKYQLPQNYFLTVGIGKEHKNILFIVEAMKQLWQEDNSIPPLLLAGTGGTLPEYLQTAVDGWEKYIFLCPHLPYVELRNLYKNATALLYPSLYEGFGFPVIEAQACGTAVLAANASVLPEVLQDSAFFFDPRDRDSFLQVFRMFWQQNKNLKQWQQAGFANAARFQWQQSARAMVQLYDTLAD